jgi:catechol 2,3-dioxygenase-like lactoylglutathione lyase family enzyme
MGMFGSVHHVGLTVKDLDRSLEFYELMFGVTPSFDVEAASEPLSRALGVEDAKLRFAFLRFGETAVELLTYDNPRLDEFALRNCDVGAPHVCIHVEDIWASYKHCKQNGAEFYSDPFHIEGGPLDGCWFVYMRDPDGITLELFQVAPTGEDMVQRE